MEQIDIANFRESIKDFSLEELNKMAGEIRDSISKMILDSDLILKAAVVDSLIKEKEEKDN